MSTSEALTPLQLLPLSEEAREAVLTAEQEDSVKHCLVCYSDLKHTAVTSCEHNEICGICHMRLRHLHSERKCPICKTDLPQIVVDVAPGKPSFQDYPVWGNDLGADFIYREDLGMFFVKDYYEKNILPLFGYYCTAPGCDFDVAINDADSKKSLIRALQDHLRNAHRLALCQLCVDHQRDFVARLPRFSPDKLSKHLKHGDGPNSGFPGHPLCEFCRPTRFYDITALHLHLAKEHYKCHVCENQGLPNQYFKHYPSLERHFDRQHFLCHDVQCLSARFMVFPTELDLRHHERVVHGGTSTGDTKVQLEFRVRRSNQEIPSSREVPSEEDFNYGLDGQAFVPADLPASQNTLAALHPLHVQRTAQLRQQAAAIREDEQTHVTEDSFPALQPAAGTPGDPGLRIGWASGATIQRIAKKPAGTVTEEDFPALPSRPQKPHPTAYPPNQRPFSSMAAAANQNRTAAGAVQHRIASSSSVPAAATSTPFAHASVKPPAAAPDLSPDSFPSLPATTRPQPYSAANALAKKNLTSNLSADHFPALGPSVKQPPHQQSPYAAAESAARKNNQQPQARTIQAPPNFDNVHDFPPPLNANTSLASNVTVDEMKTTLGAVKYKQLKGYTKEFVAGALSPVAYVDHVASLFDRGYSDNDFWRFLPNLVASCPNEHLSKQASKYMENLRRARNGAANAEALQASKVVAAPKPAAASGSGWAGAGPHITPAPPTMSYPSVTSFPPPAVQYLPGRSKVAVKSAWGAGNSAVVRAKASPGSGSLVASAATTGPQMGTGTKFMAKEFKQAKQQQQQQTSNPKKAKSKEKNELRSLAFGS